MERLKKGDKFWVGKRDGASKKGWAVWNGKSFDAPCGLNYTCAELMSMLNMWLSLRYVFVFMYEQLIAEGSLPRFKNEMGM
ncbi:MAG: hypothetical protein V3S55_07760 [Nitrospiraceae bacterium]